MVVFLNGKFLPEEQAVVSVFDRSFLYGDGLFETILVANCVPFRWTQHLERLERGAAFLGISLPFGPAEVRGFAERLLLENRMTNAMLRLSLSRGIGVRGYSPRGANTPLLVMTLHPVAVAALTVTPAWRLRTSSFKLPAGESLAQFKTCNKLPQILARAEAEQNGVDEALLLNTDGFVVEGATSNLFWLDQGAVCTPSLASGVLSGVTRGVVFEVCQTLGLKADERSITGEHLLNTAGVFLSLSSVGIAEGSSLDGQLLRRSPITAQIRRAYLDMVHRETGATAQ